MKLEHLLEMAAKKLCDKCGKSMAANHYWYKGGWKCKAAKPEVAPIVAPPLPAVPTQASIPKTAGNLKVGDVVGFKYDVEQSGPIVQIRRDHYGPIFTVRATQGGYAEESGGEAYVDFRFDDLWVD